jgi:flagellar hook assembly protein FlgD
VTACADSVSISKNLFRPAQETLAVSVTFACYPGQYDVKIYNSAGEFVRTLDSQYIRGPFSSSFPPWDGTNASGENVASGVYLFSITEPFKRRVAKVLLVR